MIKGGGWRKHLTALCLTCTIACLGSPTAQKLSLSPSSAKVGAVIRNLNTGEYTVLQNADTPFIPASVTKCFTAAAQVAQGNLDKTFITRVQLVGDIEGAIARADIVVNGVGDPSLESPLFPEYMGFCDSIASHLQAIGITSIKGNVKIEGSLPDAGSNPLWDDYDTRWYYGTGLYAFNYKGNAEGDKAVANPQDSFISNMHAALLRHGLTLEETADLHSNVTTEIYSHTSPSIGTILWQMMMRSDNLLAEGMLRALAPGRSRKDALAVEANLLGSLGVDTWGMKLGDGSGLSRGNLITPRQLNSVLQTMASHPRGTDYLNFFPLVGQEGTVKHFLEESPLAGSLILKSGSMKGVLCYAGYKLDTEGHPTHSVVIMVNHFTRKHRVKEQLASFLEKVFLPEHKLHYLTPSQSE